jgi:hypothetical protein
VKLSFAFSVGCGKQHAEDFWSLIERECGLSIRLPDEWFAWTSSYSGAAYSLCGGRASIAAQKAFGRPIPARPSRNRTSAVLSKVRVSGRIEP